MAKRRKSARHPVAQNRESEKKRSRPPLGGRGAARASSRKTPLERAQTLVDKAFEARSFERQLALADEALGLSEDCADAYTLISQFVGDPRESRLLLERGLAAAERVLGPEAFAAASGRFWLVPETRPYMRSRLALADCLWNIGLPNEAVEHLTAMLQLNPSDNQGVRYILAAHLLQLGRDEELDRLLATYAEPGAFLAFSKVLHEFRRSGDTPGVRKLLEQARHGNRHVVPLLLRGRQDEHSPTTWSPGHRDEAVLYVHDFASGWKQTPGAISWLRKLVESESHRPQKGATGPSAVVKKQLAKLPQQYGTLWQASITRAPTWLRDGDRLVRPWSILIVNHSEHQIVWQQLIPQEPTPELLFDHLARAMQKPLAGKMHRPSEIQVRESPLWTAVMPHLEEVGVDCICRSELAEADYLVAEMQRLMHTEMQPPALVDTADFNSAQGSSFYAAAADYFRRHPWLRMPADAVILVDSPQLREFGPGRWFASVMGQAGQTFGLAIYDDKQALEDICEGCCSAGDELPGTCLSLIFNEAFEVPVADLTEAERHHWPLAGPEAYPFVLCTERGCDVRQIEPWELQLLEGCVRAIPDFVEQHLYADALGGSKSVTVSSNSLKLTLNWAPRSEHGCGSECEHCDD